MSQLVTTEALGEGNPGSEVRVWVSKAGLTTQVLCDLTQVT